LFSCSLDGKCKIWGSSSFECSDRVGKNKPLPNENIKSNQKDVSKIKESVFI
jgi:hypothetical protein